MGGSFGKRSGHAAITPAVVAAGLVTLVALVIVRPPWQSQGPELTTRTMTVGGVSLTVEVADEPDESTRGLGYRTDLAAGTGMLFPTDPPRVQSFWMKGMRFCLDIVWIANDVVVGAAESICPAPPGSPDEEIPSTLSPEPVDFVLEVPAGWMATNDLGVGSPVSLAPEENSAS